jgi:cyclophilin family peptidyl-prolyl cis-trans isomerase
MANMHMTWSNPSLLRVCHPRMQYYNGVIFHRNIKGFMIQGGECKSWSCTAAIEATKSVSFEMLGMMDAQ